MTLGPLTNLARALQREPELPRLLRRWVLMGGVVPVARQHRADDRVEHPLRSGGGEDRLRRGRGRGRRRSARSRSASTSPRRPRSRPTTSSPSPAAPAARRTTRSPCRAARTRCTRSDRSRRTRSSGSSPTRCASTWSSTRATTASTARSSTTRWPWPPPSTRRLIRTEALAVDVELAGTAHDRRDRHRLAAGLGPRAEPRRGRRGGRRGVPRRFVERVGGLAARLATAHT